LRVGFRVLGLRFKVEGFGSRGKGSECTGEGSGFRVSGFTWPYGSGVQGVPPYIYASCFRVWGIASFQRWFGMLWFRMRFRMLVQAGSGYWFRVYLAALPVPKVRSEKVVVPPEPNVGG